MEISDKRKEELKGAAQLMRRVKSPSVRWRVEDSLEAGFLGGMLTDVGDVSVENQSGYIEVVLVPRN